MIDSGLIFGGGLLLTAFSIAAWPLQRYRPERLALAAVYRELSTLARRQTYDDADVPALSGAMTTLQQTLLGRHHARGRAMEAGGRAALQDGCDADAGEESVQPAAERAAEEAAQLGAEGALHACLDHVNAPEKERHIAGELQKGEGKVHGGPRRS